MSIGLEQFAWEPPSHPDEAANTDTPSADLSAREAALIDLAAAVVTGAADAAFQVTVERGLTDGGLTHEHVQELLRQVAPYAGLSATAIAFERLVEITDLEPAQGEAGHGPRLVAGTVEYSAWALEGLRAVDPVFASQLHSYTEDLWERPGLSKRERALVTLATDIVTNALGGLFSVHVALARQHGVAFEEVAAMIRLLGERAPHHGIEAFEALSAIAAS